MCGSFTCSKNTLVGLNVIYLMVSFLIIGVAVHSKVSGIVTDLPIIGGITASGVFLMFISVVYVASMMMEVSQVTEWGVSVVGLVMSTITASLWVLGNDKLREFTGGTIRGMFSIPR